MHRPVRLSAGVVGMRGARGLVAVVACAIAGVLLLAPSALSAGIWSASGSLNTARAGHTETLLPSGKVLVAGGYGPTGGGFFADYLASAELYDPSTGTWSATGSMNTPRSAATATLLPSGKVLVAGGAGDGAGLSDRLASAELYDPSTGIWSATAPLNDARIWHTATLLPSGKVLVAAGLGEVGFTASAELYDPSAGTWSATGSLNTSRYVHTATLLAGGKVLVAGGFGETGGLFGGFLASAELYDPSTGTWSATGSLNNVRDRHTATLLPSGKVLVAGGEVSGASAELYEPSTGSWSVTGSLNNARELHTATLLPSGKVLVAGGLFGGFLASAELYDPSTATWSATASLITAREAHTATLLPSGKVLVAGGSGVGGVGSNSALASTELYSTATPADLAAQLVTVSAAKGPGGALANKAAAIQAAVNAGQTATACAAITDYLALVEAQTGKKLTAAEAQQLTDSVNEIRTQLGC